MYNNKKVKNNDKEKYNRRKCFFSEYEDKVHSEYKNW